MRSSNSYQGGIWALALFLGLAGFVIWDQARGGGSNPQEGRPAVTGTAPAAERPGRTAPPAPETEAADDETSDTTPGASGVM
jgi:hypothetical protein